MLTLNSMLVAQRQAESYGQGGRHYFDGRHEAKHRPASEQQQDDKGLVRCFDARTGEYVWREIIRLPKT